MYSRESINQLKILINLGYKLKLLPFEIILKVSSIIVLQIMIMCLGAYYEAYYDADIIERVYFLIAAVIMLNISPIQLATAIYSAQIHVVLNTLLIFGPKQHHFHKTGLQYVDGLEVYFKLLVSIAFGANAFSVPAAFLAAYLEIHGLKLITFNPLPALAFAIVMPSIAFADWVFFVFLAGTALLYTNTTRTSLNLMKWTKCFVEDSDEERTFNPILLKIYRSHQILNNLIISHTRFIVFLFIGGSSSVMIGTTYALIAYFDKLSIPFLFLFIQIGSITYLSLGIEFNLSSSLTYASTEFSLSYLTNDFGISKINRLKLKASRTLYVHTGNIDKAKKTTFPTILSDVVMSTCIDLLLM